MSYDTVKTILITGQQALSFMLDTALQVLLFAGYYALMWVQR